MTAEIPRLRMIAGPNGSGKSTIKSVLGPKLLGLYINPDEIEKTMKSQGFLSLDAYGITSDAETISGFFADSQLLKKSGHGSNPRITLRKGILTIDEGDADSYFASVLSDFLRQRLIEQKSSFTFETVMSFKDKVELLKNAQGEGFRTYLYYIATDDPAINIARVNARVEDGGHSVPEDKIVSRYYKSLDLLIDAIKFSNRAYLFDNSNGLGQHFLVAEITDGSVLQIKSTRSPAWFRQAVWDKIPH